MALDNISEWPWYYFVGIGLAFCIFCVLPMVISFVRFRNNQNNAGKLLKSRKPKNAEIVPAHEGDKWMAHIQCECGSKTAVMMECAKCHDETHYCSECGRAQAPCECDWESVSFQHLEDADMASHQVSPEEPIKSVAFEDRPARGRRESIREKEVLRRKSVELEHIASKLREEQRSCCKCGLCTMRGTPFSRTSVGDVNISCCQTPHVQQLLSLDLQLDSDRQTFAEYTKL